MQEYQTSKIIAKHLEQMKVSYHFLPDDRGLIATIPGDRPLSLAYRCEIDALKIPSPYIPEKSIYSHVCGHDAHIAIMLTCIKILQEHPSFSKPTVYFVFQPEEEIATGAKKCIQYGAFFSKIDSIFTLHLSPEISQGSLYIQKGPLLYGAEQYTLTIHLSEQNDGKLLLKKISAFFENISSKKDTLVSIRKSHISEGKLQFSGIIRYKTSPHLKSFFFLLEDFLKKEKEDNLSTQLFTKTICPPVHNDPSLCDLALSTPCVNFSQKDISPAHPILGGDDFGFYLEKKKGLYVLLGSRNTQKNFTAPLHTHNFNFEKKILSQGYIFSLQYITSYKKYTLL